MQYLFSNVLFQFYNLLSIPLFIIALLAVFFLFGYLRRKCGDFSTDASSIDVIEAPILGFLDLSAGDATPQVDADKTILGPIFSSTSDSKSEPPRCDVLFVYGRLQSDGRVQGSDLGLREMIRDSGAAVLVVATANPGESCVAAAKKGEQETARANIVMTLDRRGEVFGRFFHQLFCDMKTGTPMPLAWVKLAPQGGPERADVPSTIFAVEVGNIAFR